VFLPYSDSWQLSPSPSTWSVSLPPPCQVHKTLPGTLTRPWEMLRVQPMTLSTELRIPFLEKRGQGKRRYWSIGSSQQSLPQQSSCSWSSPVVLPTVFVNASRSSFAVFVAAVVAGIDWLIVFRLTEADLPTSCQPLFRKWRRRRRRVRLGYCNF